MRPLRQHSHAASSWLRRRGRQGSFLGEFAANSGSQHRHSDLVQSQPLRGVQVAALMKVGDVLEGLELEHPLGTGASATTWRARASGEGRSEELDLRENQSVAVKLLRLEDGWRSLDLFQREASVLQRLRHPAIPQYFGSLVRERPDGSDFGLVSALVNGETLDALVRSGRWTADASNVLALAKTLLGVCEHLATFAPPVVHRDIKPSNIVLEEVDSLDGGAPSWRAFLVDFGAAVLGSGARTTAVGTFGYMSPECFGQVFTPKSDLYSLGATLLFAATGREPGSFEQERLRIKFRDAFVGTIWEREEAWLPELLDGLLAPAPEDRYASAAEAAEFLRTQASRGSAAGSEVGPLIGSRLAALAEELEPPRGSGIVAKRRGFELEVLIPPPPLVDVLPNALFGVAWVAFTATWTAGVVASGALLMSLFSLPFWGAGGVLLKESIGTWLRGAVVLNVDRNTWRCGKAARPVPIAEGLTSKLECSVEDVAVVNGKEIRCVTLTEGLVECRCGEGLNPKEVMWLQSLISNHIKRCRRGGASVG